MLAKPFARICCAILLLVPVAAMAQNTDQPSELDQYVQQSDTLFRFGPMEYQYDQADNGYCFTNVDACIDVDAASKQTPAKAGECSAQTMLKGVTDYGLQLAPSAKALVSYPDFRTALDKLDPDSADFRESTGHYQPCTKPEEATASGIFCAGPKGSTEMTVCTFITEKRADRFYGGF